MTPRAVNSRHAIDSCTLQLHAWKPFHLQTNLAVDASSPYPFQSSKKPCRSDRSTAPEAAILDLSRLTLLDDPTPRREEGVRWFQRKRRRRGSRSVSGRSSDRSGTVRRAGGGASGTYATCSDFPLAAGGTDSSGEMFVNGDGSWASDVSEVTRFTKKEAREVTGGGGGALEKEGFGFGLFQVALPESQGNESGYGSEPGYRGDGELGGDDEFDEEEDDVRPLFWGEEIGGLSH